MAATRNLHALTPSGTRTFVVPATLVKWLPAMLAHPHILLSATVLASTWLDMHAGCSGDSRRTTLIKSETLGWINERLRDPATQSEDFTLMVILHLLAGEMCTEISLQGASWHKCVESDLGCVSRSLLRASPILLPFENLY